MFSHHSDYDVLGVPGKREVLSPMMHLCNTVNLNIINKIYDTFSFPDIFSCIALRKVLSQQSVHKCTFFFDLSKFKSASF